MEEKDCKEKIVQLEEQLNDVRTKYQNEYK